MSVCLLLDKLDCVRVTGPGRWIARCPAHEDRHASLSVRELDDGRVLVHDFAGCSVHEIVSAVGIELTDLFPPRVPGRDAFKRERRPFPAADVLRCVAFEALVVAIAAGRLGNGHALTDEDKERLLVAASRLQAAVTESGHA
jgi:hypothetical protein